MFPKVQAFTEILPHFLLGSLAVTFISRLTKERHTYQSRCWDPNSTISYWAQCVGEEVKNDSIPKWPNCTLASLCVRPETSTKLTRRRIAPNARPLLSLSNPQLLNNSADYFITLMEQLSEMTF